MKPNFIPSIMLHDQIAGADHVGLTKRLFEVRRIVRDQYIRDMLEIMEIRSEIMAEVT